MLRFFFKKAIILLGAVITVFLLASFAAQGKYQGVFFERALTTVLSPIEYLVAKVSYSAKQAGSFTGQLFTVYSDNQALRAENEQLKQTDVNITELIAENERLKTMLDYKKTSTQFDLLPAVVVARDPGSWTNVIVIDRGTKDGINKGMPVVTSQGLVGNVVSVFNNSAKVQLILDPHSAVGALVQRPESRVAAIVEGYAPIPLSPRMVKIARDADIIKGDKVITSGFGGIYPKGLLVGEVTDVVNEEGGLLKYALLKPSVDFDRLEEVFVIVNSREPVPTLPPATPDQPKPGSVKGAGQ